MDRGLGLIGPTVLLAILGLPIVALAGLWWRLFPPERAKARRPMLGAMPATRDLAAEV